MNVEEAFPQSYSSARAAFRVDAARQGWTLQSLPRGQDGEIELSTDIARCGTPHARRMLIVSSGLHGVEGYFGSAVQRAILNDTDVASVERAGGAVLLVHALNPFGFSHIRRMDEENIDPNRNFLQPNESYRGAPEVYCKLEALLNPRRWPRRETSFHVLASLAVLRYGLKPLKQAVASGQYEFPKGLFFGGHRACSTNLMLQRLVPEWQQQADRILHLDLHTGLGTPNDFSLLLDHPLTSTEQRELQDLFGKNLKATNHQDRDYDCRGDIGRWMRRQAIDQRIISICAEFGTKDPIAVVGAIRAENAAFHHCEFGDKADREAREHLLEAFCPAAETWRSHAWEQGRELVSTAIHLWLMFRRGSTESK